MFCKLLLMYCVATNLLAYGLMAMDKRRSKKRGVRISENTFFLMALCLGAIGVYMGMQAPLYHKAAKPKFRYGIPALILINGMMVFFLYRIW